MGLKKLAQTLGWPPRPPARPVSQVHLDLAATAAQHGWPVREILPAATRARLPSRTIPACVLAMARNFDRWISLNENTRAHGSRTAAETYYAELYACVEEPCPSVFQCDVPGAMVEIEFGFVFAGGGILQDSSLVHAGPVLGRFSQSDPAPRLRGGYLSLLSPWTNNHAHWLMDALPKLAAIDFDPGERLLLVHPDTPDYQMRGYESFGIPAGAIVRAPRTPFVVEDLRVIRAATHPGQPHPVLLRRLRERLGAPTGPRNGARLYISRRTATRDFLNATEVEAELKTRGFVPVVPESLSFAEQVRLFADAEILLGAHGAGTMNILLAPAGCHLVEIYNPRVWDSAAARIAGGLGHPHWHLFSEPTSHGFDTRVDIGWLRSLLGSLETHLAP